MDKLHHEHDSPHFHEVGKVTETQRDLRGVFKNSVRVMQSFHLEINHESRQ